MPSPPPPLPDSADALVRWLTPRLTRTDDGAAAAAVAAVLRPSRGGPEVLLIRRAVRPGDPWSGQMALPGGRRDAGDADLRQTAQRETDEEVGLDLATHAEWVGSLDAERTQLRGLLVQPVVWVERRRGELRPNRREVAATCWAPLAALDARERLVELPDGRRIARPAWQVPEGAVWGVTLAILRRLAACLTTASPAGESVARLTLEAGDAHHAGAEEDS